MLSRQVNKRLELRISHRVNHKVNLYTKGVAPNGRFGQSPMSQDRGWSPVQQKGYKQVNLNE